VLQRGAAKQHLKPDGHTEESLFLGRREWLKPDALSSGCFRQWATRRLEIRCPLQ